MNRQPHDPSPDMPLPHITSKLMTIMDEMIRLMEEEIPLVRHQKYEQQNAIIRRKQELTLDYHATLQSLAAKKNSLSPEERATLQARGTELEKTAMRNAEAVRLAHHATDRLLQVMMNEIRKDQYAAGGYSQQGNMKGAESDRSRPLACNQRV